ncbi:MAG: hypothetical protein ABUL49_00760 [bacterium]
MSDLTTLESNYPRVDEVALQYLDNLSKASVTIPRIFAIAAICRLVSATGFAFGTASGRALLSELLLFLMFTVLMVWGCAASAKTNPKSVGWGTKLFLALFGLLLALACFWFRFGIYVPFAMAIYSHWDISKRLARFDVRTGLLGANWADVNRERDALLSAVPPGS